MYVIDVYFESAAVVAYPVWRNRFNVLLAGGENEDAAIVALSHLMRAMSYLHRRDVFIRCATLRRYGQETLPTESHFGVFAVPDVGFEHGLREVFTPVDDDIGLCAKLLANSGNHGHNWFFGSLNAEDIGENYVGGIYLKPDCGIQSNLAVEVPMWLNGGGITPIVVQGDKTRRELSGLYSSGYYGNPYPVRARMRQQQYDLSATAGQDYMKFIVDTVPVVVELEKRVKSALFHNGDFNNKGDVDTLVQLGELSLQFLTRAISFVSNSHNVGSSGDTRRQSRFWFEASEYTSNLCMLKSAIESAAGYWFVPGLVPYVWPNDGQNYYTHDAYSGYYEYAHKLRKMAPVVCGFDWLTELEVSGNWNCDA